MKLSLSRLLSRETATRTLAEELGLDEQVGEKDLYSAMAWLLAHQERIERTLAIEVFAGDTADASTVEEQVDKLRERFGMEKPPGRRTARAVHERTSVTRLSDGLGGIGEDAVNL